MIDDNVIIDLFIKRDEKAIKLTSEKYGKGIRTMAYRVLADHLESEECENDTYLRAWNSIPPNEPREHFFPFLARIVRGIAIDRYRQRKRRKSIGEFVEMTEEIENMLQSKDDTSSGLEQKEMTQIMNRFLGEVSEEKRNIFLRRYWFFDSVSDIADRYSISEGKVKTVLFRLRCELKEYLEKEGYVV